MSSDFYLELHAPSSVWAAVTKKKIPQTGRLKQQKCIPHCSGGRRSKIKVLADLVSGGSPSLGSQTAVFSRCPRMAEGKGIL